MSSKQTLREQAIKHRAMLDNDMAQADDAAQLFFDTFKPSRETIIAAYFAKDREFPVFPVMEAFVEGGGQIVLPVIQPDSRVLKFALWTPDMQVKENKYGIIEPDSEDFIDPDIVICPLLAFDRRGHRLGYGGGYYDHTLHDLRGKKDIVAVGMCYAEQAVLFPLPKDDNDQSLDWVITPREAHYFGE